MTQIFASNIGGTGTLIGDPPNIMIGSAAHLEFIDFLDNTGLVAVIVLIVLIIGMRFIYGRQLGADPQAISGVMKLDENKSIEDYNLLKKSVVMMVFVVIGFMIHGKLGVDSSVVALTAGIMMLLIGKQNVEHIILEVEWTTILFFFGLFIVVGGMVETGVIGQLAQKLIDATQGNMVATMMVLVWGSAILSAILDNIPFVATLIPLIIAMESKGIDILPLWWAVSLGACLGGNGTLVGASANVVLSSISKKQGYPISFKEYTKMGFPVMVVSVIIASIYLLIRY